MADVKGTVNTDTQNTMTVIERDKDRCYRNSLERYLAGLEIVEKTELLECIENLMCLSKEDWLRLDRDGKKTLAKEIADKVIIK
jgi:hypothetical protein